MISKEQFRKEATFNRVTEEFVLLVYSKIFNKKIKLIVTPEDLDINDGEDGITDRIIEISNDLIKLESSNLEMIQETVWKCFNRYGELVSYTLTIDNEKYDRGEISKNEYQSINKQRQQELYDISSMEDCWNKIGEPEYRTCLFPEIWNHRFGFITFYPAWEENGLNILVRNGRIIGYANGPDPIVKELDNPALKSVYELWQ